MLYMKKVLFAIIMLAASLPAWADEKTLSIGEVVITATRAEEEVEKISANVTVITQEKIKKSTATTVQDLLKNEDGIFISDLYGTGTKSSVDMRGFAYGANTVVLIDGRRLNEVDTGSVDWNLIPLENVERIEIVRGTESVLYGDNALAGAINIITKKGARAPELVIDARGESYHGHTEYATFQGANEKIGYFFLIKNRSTSGYRDNSEFFATDMNARINLNVNEFFTLDFGATYHQDRQGLPGGLTEAQVKHNRKQADFPDDGTKYRQPSYDVKANILLSTWGNLELAYSYNDRKFGSDLIFFGDTYSTDRDSETISLRAKLTVDTKPFDRRNLLITGIDYYDSNVLNETASIYSVIHGDVTKREVGLYIQDEFFVTEKLSFSLGYRASFSKLEGTATGWGLDWSSPDWPPPHVPISEKIDQTNTEDAYKVGITYNYAKASKVYASYARGYRLPTVDDVFIFNGSIVDLKPETSDTYEIGLLHTFNNKVQAKLTAYTMDVKDRLFFNSIIFATVNLDKTHQSGIEAGITAPITDSLTAFGNLTYTKATFDNGPNDGKDLPLIPRHSANIGADYRPMKGLLLVMNANWVGDRYLENDTANDLKKLDSYLAVNSKIAYTYKNATAYVGVNNIFNDKYSGYGAAGFGGSRKYYPAPERNFYGGVRVVF
jgi:iron complex outermembrane receptor protein